MYYFPVLRPYDLLNLLKDGRLACQGTISARTLSGSSSIGQWPALSNTISILGILLPLVGGRFYESGSHLLSLGKGKQVMLFWVHVPCYIICFMFNSLYIPVYVRIIDDLTAESIHGQVILEELLVFLQRDNWYWRFDWSRDWDWDWSIDMFRSTSALWVESLQNLRRLYPWFFRHSSYCYWLVVLVHLLYIL